MALGTLVILVLLITVCSGNDGPIVQTPLGKVRGYHKLSFQNHTYSAFQGIRYAKPPIGNLRFEEPQPTEPWLGIWNANLTITCSQQEQFTFPLDKGEEDCLFINVFVPNEQPNCDLNLDVIVHIHGGGYLILSGNEPQPDYLMDKDVIFVTFNYRLGILGFLSTEDNVVPGNNGLKDQVLALKWIQKNIKSFGGNPNSVTITGMSAGGASVQMHYLSPLSKGLFHKGISQSGVALNPFNLHPQPLKQAQKLATLVGCPNKPNTILVQCLKQKPVEQLTKQMPNFYEYKILPITPFAAVIENGPNAFINKHPYYLLLKGLVHDVPWIASNTAHEGLLNMGMTKEDLNDRWEEIAPYLYNYYNTLPKASWAVTAKKIREFYFGANQEIPSEFDIRLIQAATDRAFLYDGETAIRMQANATKSPVYYYFFNYKGQDEAFVYHATDTNYCYPYKFLSRKLQTESELKMKSLVLNMIVSFAKTGRPDFGVPWDPLSSNVLKYLNITSPENVKLQTAKELSPRKFWGSLGFMENQNLFSKKNN